MNKNVCLSNSLIVLASYCCNKLSYTQDLKQHVVLILNFLWSETQNWFSK